MKRGSVTIKGKNVKGSFDILLDGSKSISNRVLIIQKLCKESFLIEGLSTSDDTKSLQKALLQGRELLDVHHAGTSFRFLTSLLAMDDKSYTLTGSSRMKERPIGPLVNALVELGANIKYLEKEGFPPLEIGSFDGQKSKSIKISGSISSQFITSLLLIAPTLTDGLDLTIEGELVSQPYVEMTLKLMQYFGVEYSWEAEVISIAPQEYKPKNINIEADWSAASYFYSMVATAKDLKVKLIGLTEDSLQGDAAIAKIMTDFGVSSSFNEVERSVLLEKNEVGKKLIEYNFIKQPDLAQTIAVCTAVNGKKGLFSGLQTLKIKETDRIEALKIELQKYGVYLSPLPMRFTKKEGEQFYMLDGEVNISQVHSIATYNDHRMAMSFATIALKEKVVIENANVVSKSYPNFWKDLEKLGFEIEES